MTEFAGTPITEWTAQPGLIDVVMFAGAMWEFQRLHFDHDWAGQEGLERAIIQGPLLGNYLTRTVDEQLGGAYGLDQITWRNLATVNVDELLTCGGTLHVPAHDIPTADLSITNETGATVISGTAVLRPASEVGRH